jgi:hypothetical protein
MNEQRGILIKKPISLLKRDLKADYSRFTEALTKTFAYGFVGNVESAMIEAKGMLSALGLQKECSQIAWFLVHSSLLQAVKDLVDERITSLPPEYKDTKKRQELIEQLDLLFEENEISIDHRFFDNPKELPLLALFKTPFSQWLAAANTAQTEIINDLPRYFLFALKNQWHTNSKAYQCLKEILGTPFDNALKQELAWMDYAKWLQKQVDNVILDDRFNLRQVYVPLRAYFEQVIELPEKIHTRTRYEKQYEKIVVDLTHELNTWVQQADPKDAVRLISGGPGCGKSSFVKVFAAHQAKLNKVAVIFIPLQRFDLHDDLVAEVNKFARRYQDDCLPDKPLDSTKPKLLIFDGLDEYAIKSKGANEAARQFVDEVHNVVHQFNLNEITQMQAIITGRDVAMQANARKFSKSRKTLHILGYYVPEKECESFQDVNHFLAVDQREQWWINYGQATKQSYTRIPDILKSDNLVEITSQPLLNYLVALSYEGGKLDFSTQNNLNSIYRDLLERILEREQREKSPNSPLANMAFWEFFRALKEVALAAWHGDGRSTTQQEIQNYFKQRGLQSLLEVFEDTEKKGVIRLLLAFYFRQTGIREEDAQGVFEFTHKSFGEYLVACRIVDMVDDIQDEMVLRRQTKPHLAWDENEALQRWIALCGIKPMDKYLFNFVCDEMRLRDVEQVHQWQKTLASLIEYLLEQGMPMERITPRLPYHDETRQARHAEEALLATLNACARVTQQLSKIQWPSPSAFGEWVYRIQGQSPSVDRVLFVECLSFLDLHDCQLRVRNFQCANFCGANLENANLEDADLMDANLTKANLEGANLNNAYLAGACLEQANLKGATLKASSFYYANLKQTHFEGANLKQADLEGADIEGADFSGAITDGKKCLSHFVGE